MIEFTVKITLKDYRTINFLLLYKQSKIIILSLIGLLNIVAFILYLNNFSFGFQINPVFNLVFGIVLLGITPLSIFLQSKKIYENTKSMQEEIKWIINLEKIQLEGKTFKAEYDWNNIYQIKQFKNWTIIYFNKIIMNVIPNKSFKTMGDFNEFWNYAEKKNIKINK